LFGAACRNFIGKIVKEFLIVWPIQSTLSYYDALHIFSSWLLLVVYWRIAVPVMAVGTFDPLILSGRRNIILDGASHY